MALVKWDDALSVGNKAIDDDHRKLFEILDKLQQAMRVGKANAVLGDILDELVRYTVTHFQREEQYMRRIGYAGYVAHKAEHDRLISEVQDLQLRFRNGALTLSISINQFLSEWLSKHIMTLDKALASELAATA